MTNLSSLIEQLAKQALNGQSANQQNNTSQQQNHQSNSGGLGGILGSVIGQVINQGNSNQSSNASNQNSSSSSGLGGILGSVLGQLGGGSANAASGGKSALLIAVLPLILAWIQKNGGIQGVLNKLQQTGMANQAQSWVNPEQKQNEQVEPEQVKALFDDADVEKVAQDTNESKQNVYSAIAGVLPQIIDALTPHGANTNQKEADNDVQNILNSLGNLLNKR